MENVKVLNQPVKGSAQFHNSYERDVSEIMAISDREQSVQRQVAFVLCTIQAGLSTVKGQMKDININGLQSKFLWGEKANGLAYVREHDAFLYGKVKYLQEKHGLDSVEGAVECIELFLKVPNLGMVKAAFVAQCLGFNVACIDSHNLKRLGMKPTQVKLGAKLKPETRKKKIREYVELTQEKGSAFWWNSWCDYVAGNRANKALSNGDIVSRFHVECIEVLEV